LRVVIDADPTRSPDEYTVEIEAGAMLARHTVKRVFGVWTATDARYVGLEDGKPTLPSARARRLVNLERHRHRIDPLLAAAADDWDVIYPDVPNPWRRQGQFAWAITAPRSKRGRPRRTDPDEILRLRARGMKDREIAARLGIHPKTPANIVRTTKGRKSWGGTGT
jgi:hypothetical protein